MSHRAGIILLQANRVALIERHRLGQHYFAFPGGHIDPGETPAQAAVRETEEELGLQVILKKMIATFFWQGHWQYYYLAEATGGVFGSGSGEEMLHPLAERGSYRPVWMPVAGLPDQNVLPRPLALLVVQAVQAGWPDQPVALTEEAH